MTRLILKDVLFVVATFCHYMLFSQRSVTLHFITFTTESNPNRTGIREPIRRLRS